MVKRILALSLLMVGLAACGSGGGASAEADTLNTLWIPTSNCNCSSVMYKEELLDDPNNTEDGIEYAMNNPVCKQDQYNKYLCWNAEGGGV